MMPEIYYRRERLIEEHKNGTQTLRLVTRQLGDDGIYRRVETVDYFVKSNYSDDVLAITLCENLADLQTEKIENEIRSVDGISAEQAAEIVKIIEKYV